VAAPFRVTESHLSALNQWGASRAG
jgi:hypothetical protein